jgi:methylated-DNA-[protein]-cysteine S-methyltransferase
MILYARHESAFGPLLLRARDGKLTGLWFADQAHAPAIDSTWRRDDKAEIFVRTIREIAEFAAGTRRTFDVPYTMSGSPFQMLVWHSIAAIPFGETRSYGELAASVGAFPRAVGSAAGRNPICLLVPCHRVVGANGALTGYAGGLERKQRLLELEKTPAFASCGAAKK